MYVGAMGREKLVRKGASSGLQTGVRASGNWAFLGFTEMAVRRTRGVGNEPENDTAR